MTTLTLTQNATMTAVDFTPEITAATAPTFLHKQLGAASNAVLATPAGASTTDLVVGTEDVLNERDWVDIGAGVPTQIDRKVSSVRYTLREARTWSNNAQVRTYAVGAASITGLALSSDGVLTGTPTTLGTTVNTYARGTDTGGLFADTSLLDIVIEAPPTPPIIIGALLDQFFAPDDLTHDIDTSTAQTGASSFAIAPAPPAGSSYNTSTGVLSFLADTVGNFGPYTVTYTNNASPPSPTANTFYVYVVAPEPVLVLEPIVVGLTQAVAIATLEAEGFITAYAGAPSPLTTGTVVIQDPPGNTYQPAGATVMLIIATPEDITTYLVGALVRPHA